jgi:hypothetical protein
MLRLIGEQCAVTQPQVARALGVGEESVRKLRRRWERAGWVHGGCVLTGRPPLVWLTGRGHRVAGVWFRPWRPALHRLEHIVAATEARLYVNARRPEWPWVCERELARRDRLAGVSRSVHRPDALVEADEGVAAVEVERTLKSRARLERIVLDLRSRYDAVWYFAPPELLPRLENHLKGCGLPGSVQLVELSDPWRRA